MNEMIPSDWCKETPTGLVIKRHPTLEEFEERNRKYGVFYYYAKQILPIYIADILLYADRTEGEGWVSQVLNYYAEGTAANYMSIMRDVTPDMRVPGATLTHYKAVRTLKNKPDKYRALLEESVKEDYNYDELYSLVSKGRLPGLIDKVRKVQDEVETWYLMSGGRVDGSIRRVLDELKMMEDKLDV
jgi:hypothetical protein